MCYGDQVFTGGPYLYEFKDEAKSHYERLRNEA